MLKRDLVLALPEREHGLHVRGVGLNRPSAARFGPAGHVVAPLHRGRAVTPGSRDQHPKEDTGPAQHPVAELIAETQSLADHGIELVPLAAEIGGVAE